MRKHTSRFLAAGIALALLGLSGGGARAGLILTAAGIADGFTLSQFAIMDPGYNDCCGGPFGLAVTGTGNVLVDNGSNTTRYTFTDTDGQSSGLGGAPPSTATNTVFSNSLVVGYAHVADGGTGHAYGNSSGQGGAFEQFNADGSFNHTLTFPGQTAIGASLGMIGRPQNGHLIATTSSSQLVDIDPLANGGLGSYRVITSLPGGTDGLSISPDGSTIYAETGGAITAYDYTSGAIVHSYPLSFNPDGTGVISGGTFNGFIVVSNNCGPGGCFDGSIGLIDPGTGIETLIADGGTRGDYTAPDLNPGAEFGTLLIDQADAVWRLSLAGSTIGGGPVPEPSSLALLGSAVLIALGAARRRKQKTV